MRIDALLLSGRFPGGPLVMAMALVLAAPLFAARADSPDLDLARRLNRAFVEVAERVSPSVVVVKVMTKSPRKLGGLEDGLFEFLPEELRKHLQEELERRQQEEPSGRPREFTGQGSGVIFREDGYILTNGHVVEDSENVQVQLRDGRRFPAEIKGIDPESDVAVIKVQASGLPAAPLGNSANVRVGEFAIAIGAPFELDYSVTFGHVSAKGRRVVHDLFMMDQDFIQTDASINPGNSGGPLINIEGEVIGINSMIRGMNTGIGFAVPINLAREVAEKLISDGRFTRAWLGINIATLAEDSETSIAGLPVTQGVVVTRIVQDGPSSGSDLRRRDVIVAVDGTAVRDVDELRRSIRNKPIGAPVTLDVYRDGRKLQVKVAPGELPEGRMALFRPPQADAQTPEIEEVIGLGLTVRELTREAAARQGVAHEDGVLVADVEKDSAAASRRIRPGDVITKVNRKPVKNLKDFAVALKDAEGARKDVTLTIVNRDGRRFEVLKAEDR